MRTTETKQVTIEQETTEATCELCGAKAVAARSSGENDWSRNLARTYETTLVCRDGWCCSDGGSGTEILVDLCYVCFRNKLVPWLESQGAKIQEKEWDW